MLNNWWCGKIQNRTAGQALGWSLGWSPVPFSVLRVLSLYMFLLKFLSLLNNFKKILWLEIKNQHCRQQVQNPEKLLFQKQNKSLNGLHGAHWNLTAVQQLITLWFHGRLSPWGWLTPASFVLFFTLRHTGLVSATFWNLFGPHLLVSRFLGLSEHVIMCLHIFAYPVQLARGFMSPAAHLYSDGLGLSLLCYSQVC